MEITLKDVSIPRTTDEGYLCGKPTGEVAQLLRRLRQQARKKVIDEVSFTRSNCGRDASLTRFRIPSGWQDRLQGSLNRWLPFLLYGKLRCWTRHALRSMGKPCADRLWRAMLALFYRL